VVNITNSIILLSFRETEKLLLELLTMSKSLPKGRPWNYVTIWRQMLDGAPILKWNMPSVSCWKCFTGYLNLKK